MDKIGGAFESLTGSGSNSNQVQGQTNTQGQGQEQSPGGGGILGGLGDKLSSAIGGGGDSDGGESEQSRNAPENVC